jgi:S-adenosylmethionine decarboxylase
MLNTMAAACEKAGATVISQVRYQFGHNSPPGFTAVVVLDESHCTAHSYADDGMLALDIFTCGETPPIRILELIRQELDLGEVQLRILQRFHNNEQVDESSIQRASPRASASAV